MGKWSCGLLLLSPTPSCGREVSEWGCRGYGGSEYGNRHWDSFHLWGKGWLRDHLLVMEPDYLPDSEVLAFSRVYTP